MTSEERAGELRGLLAICFIATAFFSPLFFGLDCKGPTDTPEINKVAAIKEQGEE